MSVTDAIDILQNMRDKISDDHDSSEALGLAIEIMKSVLVKDN